MPHFDLEQDKMSEQGIDMEGRPHTHKMLVGEVLQRARVHYKQSLAQVEKDLRIPLAQLEAIEDSRYDQLPARVYAIGFIRSYAQYLGFNSEEIVRLFKEEAMSTKISPDLNFPVSAEQSNLPSKWIVLGSVAALILISILWGQVTSLQDPETPSVYDVSKKDAHPTFSMDVMPSDSVAKSNSVHMMGPDVRSSISQDKEKIAEQAPLIQKKGVILSIKDNSWVEIRNADGKRLVSRVLKAGDQYFVPDEPGLTMSIGNAGGVELIIDGKTLAPFGAKGAVVRNVTLNSTALKSLAKDP